MNMHNSDMISVLESPLKSFQYGGERLQAWLLVNRRKSIGFGITVGAQ